MDPMPPSYAQEVSSAEPRLQSADGLISYRTVGLFVGLLDVALIIGSIGSPEELARLSTRDLFHSYGTREVGRFEF